MHVQLFFVGNKGDKDFPAAVADCLRGMTPLSVRAFSDGRRVVASFEVEASGIIDAVEALAVTVANECVSPHFRLVYARCNGWSATIIDGTAREAVLGSDPGDAVVYGIGSAAAGDRAAERSAARVTAPSESVSFEDALAEARRTVDEALNDG